MLHFATTVHGDSSEAPSRVLWSPPRLSNDEIAKELWITHQTVKFHLTNIYRKPDVENRTEATRLAYQQELVESPFYGEE